MAIPLFTSWTWQMAWRDSRSSRRRLALFSCSIVLGIAALAAIGSLGSNLERAIGEQAKSLLGADLVIGSRQPFSPAEEELFRQLGGEQSREIVLSTMAYFPRGEGTRLVQLRALRGDFPFYGTLDAEPANAGATFRQAGGGAVVEDNLLHQFELNPGDEIRLGDFTTRIAGRLKKVPGQNIALATLAPRVYIAFDDLPRAGLLGEGSLVRYQIYFKFAPERDMTQLVRKIKPQLDQFRLSHSTVEERQRDLGRSLDNLYHFLNLVGFIALLLGGVGVASAIHTHVKDKLGTVAILRCLGGSISQTFAVYLAQGMALGLFGAVLGGALGIAIQTALPRMLADFIPFTFQFHTAWDAVARAMGVGFSICLLFALLPLLRVRQVSPLAALRIAVIPQPARRDPWRWLVGLVLVAGIVAFAVTQSRDGKMALGLTAGLGVVVGVLAATARGLVVATRRFLPAALPFAVRQGVANLHRPNNRTLLLLLALGLGTFLMLSLFLVHQTLLTQLIAPPGKDQPNTALFDIQTSQRDGLRKLLATLQLPVLDEVPIVTMRLSSVKGRSVESLLADPQRLSPAWQLRREYRSTYRDRLHDGEKLVAGTFVANVPPGTAIVPISMESEIAKDLQLGLGDEVVFDLQGVPLTARVTSWRTVDWRRIQPNFFVVFPTGVLEAAPTMHVMLTRVPTSAEAGRLQREVVLAFPNISVVDLTLILQTIDSILSKISFVIRFMALFTVLTGLLVLVSALVTGRYQRMRESVLLRTLGASRRQILNILAVEYLALGLLAALTGIVLAVGASWALAQFVFKVGFAFQAGPVVVALLVVPGITVVTGLLMSRGVLNQPPLAVLRGDA